MIIGLHQKLEDLQTQRKRRQAFADAGIGSARELHDAAVFVKTAEGEIFALKAAILEGGEMVREIQGVLNQLHVSKHQSRHRSLATTALENAQSRLLREIGDKPHETKTA